jgi:hypothetical protein
MVVKRTGDGEMDLAGGPGGIRSRLIPPVTAAGCVCLAASLVAMLAAGTIRKWTVWAPFGLAVLLTAAGIALDWKRFKISLANRRLLTAFMVMVNALLGMAMLALAGYFFGARYFLLFDLTRMKELTLSEQSIRILSRLKDIEPVEAILVEGRIRRVDPASRISNRYGG